MTNPIIDKLQSGQTVDSVPPMLNSLFRELAIFDKYGSYEQLSNFQKLIFLF